MTFTYQNLGCGVSIAYMDGQRIGYVSGKHGEWFVADAAFQQTREEPFKTRDAAARWLAPS